jgi:putative membrane protein insertion efficiency factor
MVKVFQKIFYLYYLLISPFLGNRCRYAPSCSEYANQALEIHGVFKGLWLTCKRLGRCHPWGGSGFDPVPRCENGCDKHLAKDTPNE